MADDKNQQHRGGAQGGTQRQGQQTGAPGLDPEHTSAKERGNTAGTESVQRAQETGKSTPLEENPNQQRINEAADHVRQQREKLAEEGGVDETPATGADIKRGAPVQGVVNAPDPQKGDRTLSDTRKRLNQEQFGDEVGRGTAESVESGVIMEGGIKQRVQEAIDQEHPALDYAPRRGLPPESNQIDLNDPFAAG